MAQSGKDIPKDKASRPELSILGVEKYDVYRTGRPNGKFAKRVQNRERGSSVEFSGNNS